MQTNSASVSPHPRPLPRLSAHRGIPQLRNPVCAVVRGRGCRIAHRHHACRDGLQRAPAVCDSHTVWSGPVPSKLALPRCEGSAKRERPQLARCTRRPGAAHSVANISLRLSSYSDLESSRSSMSAWRSLKRSAALHADGNRLSAARSKGGCRSRCGDVVRRWPRGGEGGGEGAPFAAGRVVLVAGHELQCRGTGGRLGTAGGDGGAMARGALIPSLRNISPMRRSRLRV